MSDTLLGLSQLVFRLDAAIERVLANKTIIQEGNYLHLVSIVCDAGSTSSRVVAFSTLNAVINNLLGASACQSVDHPTCAANTCTW
jgi:hypothetical protein